MWILKGIGQFWIVVNQTKSKFVIILAGIMISLIAEKNPFLSRLVEKLKLAGKAHDSVKNVKLNTCILEM